jgi:fructoselysine-6-P-deglycase FrlB-like protein
MINFSSYKDILKDTLLISPTRSGSTSEVINAIKLAKENLKVSCISVSTCVNSPVSQFADLSLEMPWAFDESVCQTRTVTNLYMADLMLIAMISDDNALIKEIESAISYGEAYIKKYSSVLEQAANKNSWNKVVVLADSELEGIAEEGALAFSEICQLHSNYYHILDLRHGPMVLIDNKTLVIVALSPSEVSYQLDLINDVKQKGAVVIAVSGRPDNIWEADIDIVAEKYKNYGVMGIPFIFVPQALSYYKAIAAGINPDEPQGLYPWIKL